MRVHFQAFIPKVLAMTNIIHVPFDSPAFESYLHEGWRQMHVDGLWATLRRDQDHRKARDPSQLDRGVSTENPQIVSTEDAA